MVYFFVSHAGDIFEVRILTPQRRSVLLPSSNQCCRLATISGIDLPDSDLESAHDSARAGGRCC